MIELRVRTVSQLFNTLDPFPFRERDLAPDAADYIVARVPDEAPQEPIDISVAVDSGLEGISPSDVRDAIHLWFASKAQAERKVMALHFRDARLALLIGICALSLCMFGAWSIARSYPDTPFLRVMQESLIIVGWVVLWRPAEMLLYDWVPMVRRRKLYERLAQARISITPTASVSQG
jgi:hypothetical protein